ncbi:FKBP-type peptidyl-prolyl cis-trans isomerase [Ketobacter sp.]|uniref:FKBP-type peptidyl-prolyl cis-trans isomerase n=1 Tax=Ketobacter sp. TaxID=2083498 RepID=UPI000F0E77BE|nr:FKBP-type peptidyl-prolyl cis-trans isomerase [Ketobacter sp.]RLU00693.1 MAG: FKBP-type peptidyl-prolyl cis-trans isomerase [Ketobacter sp.]
MKKYIIVATAVAALVACKGEAGSEGAAAKSEPAVALQTEDQKASYAIGLKFGEGMGRDLKDELDVKAFYQGFDDGFSGNESKMTQEEMVAAMNALQARKMQEQQAAQSKALEENKVAGDTFLEENKKRDGVIVTESGLQYEVITKGDGETPDANDKVNVHYHGTLPDGTVFDSSVERGEPISFPVNGVIKGWTEALQLMKVGDKWKLFIPSDLAYGARGAGPKIGPNQVLVFDVELLGVEKVE